MGERRRHLGERPKSAAWEREGPSEASIILQRFKERYGGRPVVKAKRRVTEKEIEVTPS